ncbi:MAG: AbrB/MazE/SpoVT family DNA-binding domain-containing protein [Kiloniellaceae bacterium]
MSESVKIRRIGNSLGVTLSEQVRAMGLQEGDSLFVVKTRDGIELTPYDPDFAEAVEAGRDFMRRYPSAMKKLAE